MQESLEIPNVPRLKTPILDSAEKPINYRILVLDAVTVTFAGKVIGRMRFSNKKDHIYIHRIDNYTSDQEKPFKGVGSLLFEYAFRNSIKNGHDGKVELNAIAAAPAAYYKMGFRKKSATAIGLGELISEYLQAPKEDEKDKKKNEILENYYFKKLMENAAVNLKKDIADISFIEAIKHGVTDALTDNINQEFEKFLAENKKVTTGDCYCLNMQGMMYLPADKIELLKRKFLDSIIPIGSNLFWSKDHAKKNLTIPVLKELVENGKLSSSNAVEIECKMRCSDPRLEILLSPLGLEMMKRNHISGWYIGVYFGLDYTKAVISPEVLNAFEKSFITINQLVNLQIAIGIQLLSPFGLQALYDGEIMISNGFSVMDKQGNYFSNSEDLKEFLQKTHAAREKVMAENPSNSCYIQ